MRAAKKNYTLFPPEAGFAVMRNGPDNEYTSTGCTYLFLCVLKSMLATVFPEVSQTHELDELAGALFLAEDTTRRD